MSDIEVRISLGRDKGAAGIDSLRPLQDVVRALQNMDKDISLKYQNKALAKAAKPGMDALRSNVRQLGSVTGNLLASVTKRSKKYTNNKKNLPVGVVVVGFRRPTNAPSQKMATPAFAGGGVLKGPNRAYHSHLVEYGTRSRTPGISTRKRVNRRRVVVNGRMLTLAERVREATGRSTKILSSGFNPKNPGDITGKRRAFKGRGQYPTDFIATGTVRGAPAQHPLQRAFNQSRQQMQSVLDSEMRKALVNAIKEVQAKAP